MASTANMIEDSPSSSSVADDAVQSPQPSVASSLLSPVLSAMLAHRCMARAEFLELLSNLLACESMLETATMPITATSPYSAPNSHASVAYFDYFVAIVGNYVFTKHHVAMIRGLSVVETAQTMRIVRVLASYILRRLEQDSAHDNIRPDTFIAALCSLACAPDTLLPSDELNELSETFVRLEQPTPPIPATRAGEPTVPPVPPPVKRSHRVTKKSLTSVSLGTSYQYLSQLLTTGDDDEDDEANESVNTPFSEHTELESAGSDSNNYRSPLAGAYATSENNEIFADVKVVIRRAQYAYRCKSAAVLRSLDAGSRLSRYLLRVALVEDIVQEEMAEDSTIFLLDNLQFGGGANNSEEGTESMTYMQSRLLLPERRTKFLDDDAITGALAHVFTCVGPQSASINPASMILHDKDDEDTVGRMGAQWVRCLRILYAGLRLFTYAARICDSSQNAYYRAASTLSQRMLRLYSFMRSALKERTGNASGDWRLFKNATIAECGLLSGVMSELEQFCGKSSSNLTAVSRYDWCALTSILVSNLKAVDFFRIQSTKNKIEALPETAATDPTSQLRMWYDFKQEVDDSAQDDEDFHEARGRGSTAIAGRRVKEVVVTQEISAAQAFDKCLSQQPALYCMQFLYVLYTAEKARPSQTTYTTTIAINNPPVRTAAGEDVGRKRHDAEDLLTPTYEQLFDMLNVEPGLSDAVPPSNAASAANRTQANDTLQTSAQQLMRTLMGENESDGAEAERATIWDTIRNEMQAASSAPAATAPPPLSASGPAASTSATASAGERRRPSPTAFRTTATIHIDDPTMTQRSTFPTKLLSRPTAPATPQQSAGVVMSAAQNARRLIDSLLYKKLLRNIMLASRSYRVSTSRPPSRRHGAGTSSTPPLVGVMVRIISVVSDMQIADRSSEMTDMWNRLIHELLVGGVLDAGEQLEVLKLLEVDIEAVDSQQQSWPLQLDRSRLAVIAHILLRWQQKYLAEEYVAGHHRDLQYKASMAIVDSVITTLTQEMQSTADSDGTTAVAKGFEDINLEHMQLILLLFQGLKLSQKKQILQHVVVSIVQGFTSDADKSDDAVRSLPLTCRRCIMLSRLLLIFEYIMHFLYEPSSELIRCVESALFARYRGISSPADDLSAVDRDDLTMSKLPTLALDDERPAWLWYASGVTPFYNTFPLKSISQDPRAFDGFATSFLTTGTSECSYSDLYAAFARMIRTCLSSQQLTKKNQTVYTKIDAISQMYLLRIVLRVFHYLPPTISIVTCINRQSDDSFRTPLDYLVAINWSIRFCFQPLYTWISEAMMKQGIASKEEASKMVPSSYSDGQRLAVKRIVYFATQMLQRFVEQNKQGGDGLTSAAVDMADYACISCALASTVIMMDMSKSSNIDRNNSSFGSNTGGVDTSARARLFKAVMEFIALVKTVHEDSVIHSVAEKLSIASSDSVSNASEQLLRFVIGNLTWLHMGNGGGAERNAARSDSYRIPASFVRQRLALMNSSNAAFDSTNSNDVLAQLDAPSTYTTTAYVDDGRGNEFTDIVSHISECVSSSSLLKAPSELNKIFLWRSPASYKSQIKIGGATASLTDWNRLLDLRHNQILMQAKFLCVKAIRHSSGSSRADALILDSLVLALEPAMRLCYDVLHTLHPANDLDEMVNFDAVQLFLAVTDRPAFQLACSQQPSVMLRLLLATNETGAAASGTGAGTSGGNGGDAATTSDVDGQLKVYRQSLAIDMLQQYLSPSENETANEQAALTQLKQNVMQACLAFVDDNLEYSASSSSTPAVSTTTTAAKSANNADASLFVQVAGILPQLANVLLTPSTAVPMKTAVLSLMSNVIMRSLDSAVVERKVFDVLLDFTAEPQSATDKFTALVVAFCCGGNGAAAKPMGAAAAGMVPVRQTAGDRPEDFSLNALKKIVRLLKRAEKQEISIDRKEQIARISQHLFSALLACLSREELLTCSDRAVDGFAAGSRLPFIVDLCVQLVPLQPSRLTDLLEQLIETLNLKVAQIVTLPDVLLGNRNADSSATTVLGGPDSFLNTNNDDYDISVADVAAAAAPAADDDADESNESVGSGMYTTAAEAKRQHEFLENDKDAMNNALLLTAALSDVRSISEFMQFVLRAVDAPQSTSNAVSSSEGSEQSWSSEALADLDAEIGGSNLRDDETVVSRQTAQTRSYAAIASSGTAQQQQQCTYATSAREFLQQHWYHCYDCGLIVNQGCCSACVRMCHAGHDVSYAKYGPFFCDCGAAQKTCKALSISRKRGASNTLQPPGDGNNPRSGSVSPTLLTSASSNVSAAAGAMKLLNSKGGVGSVMPTKRSNITAAAAGRTTEMITTLPFSSKDDWQMLTDVVRSQSSVVVRLLTDTSFLDVLSQSIEAVTSHIAVRGDDADVMVEGVRDHLRLIKRLSRNLSRMETKLLKSTNEESTVVVESNDDAMQPQQQQPVMMSGEEIMQITIQAPEGAFKHARNPFMGDTGSNLRQLITHGMINRSGLCALGEGAQKHLAIVSEKSVVHIMDASQIFSRFSSPPLLQRAAPSPRPPSRSGADADVGGNTSAARSAATAQPEAANNTGDAATSAATVSATGAAAASGSAFAGQQKVINIAIFSSITLQFPVLSLCGNPQVDRVVIACGMRQASLIVFGPKPTHEPVTPLQYAVPCGVGDTNYIIRVVWLPGCNAGNEFAVVTPDFVKLFIASFGTDKVELVATLLAPHGGSSGGQQNIRDCTFAYFSPTGKTYADGVQPDGDDKSGRYAFVMTTGGDVYYEKIADNFTRQVNVYNSLLSYGSNTSHPAAVVISSEPTAAASDDGEFEHQLAIDDERIKRDVENTDSNCGVAIYYSHALRLMLCSYSSGKLAVLKMANFLSSIESRRNMMPADDAVETDVKTTDLDDAVESATDKQNASAVCLKPTIFVAPRENMCPSSFASVNGQSMSNFSELSTLPGFVFYSTTVGSVPGVLRIDHERIAQQTLKLRADKNPVDLALVRQNVLKDPTMPLACAMVVTEDGGFKVFVTDAAWFVWPAHSLPAMPPTSSSSLPLPTSRVGTTWKHYLSRVGALDDATHMPVDVFEKCKPLYEVAFECKYLWEQYPREYVNKLLSPPLAQQSRTSETGGGVMLANATVQPAATPASSSAGMTISRLPLTMVAVNLASSQYVACALRVQVRSKSTRKCQLTLKLNNAGQQSRQILMTFTQERWFDIPLTWNEAASVANRIEFTISSASATSSSTTGQQSQPQEFVLLGVRLYGVPRDEFGLPDAANDSRSSAIPFGALIGSGGAGNEMAMVQMLTGTSQSCLRELLNLTLLSHSLTTSASVSTEKSDADTDILPERNTQFAELEKCTFNIASSLNVMPRDVVQRANRLFFALNNNNVDEYFEKKSRVILRQAMKVLHAVDDYHPSMNVSVDAKNDDNYAVISTVLQRVLAVLRPLAAKRPQSFVKSMTLMLQSPESTADDISLWQKLSKMVSVDAVGDENAVENDDVPGAKSAIKFIRLLNGLYIQLITVLPSTDDCASIIERTAIFDVQLVTETIVMLNVALLSANLDTKNALTFLFGLLTHKRPIVAYACKQALVDTIKPVPFSRSAASTSGGNAVHLQRAGVEAGGSKRPETVGNVSVTLLSEEEQRVQQQQLQQQQQQQQGIPYNRSSLRRQGAVRQPHTSSVRQRLAAPTSSSSSSSQHRPPPPPPPAPSSAARTMRELEWARLLAAAESATSNVDAAGGGTSSTLSPIAALLPAAARVAQATSGLMQRLSDEQQRAMSRVMSASSDAAGMNNMEQHNLHGLIDDPALLGWALNGLSQDRQGENNNIASEEALQQLNDNASSIGIASSIQPQFGDESTTSDTASAVSDGEDGEDDDDDADDHDDDDDENEEDDDVDEDDDENDDNDEDGEDDNNDDDDGENEDENEAADEPEDDEENMELINIEVDDEEAAAAVVAAVLNGNAAAAVGNMSERDLAEYENILFELGSNSRVTAGSQRRTGTQRHQQQRRRRATRSRRAPATGGGGQTAVVTSELSARSSSTAAQSNAGSSSQPSGSVGGEPLQAQPGNFVEAETASMVSSVFGSVGGGAGSDSAAGENGVRTPTAESVSRKPLSSDSMPPLASATVKKLSASVVTAEDGGSSNSSDMATSVQAKRNPYAGFVRTQIIEMLLNKLPDLEQSADSNRPLPALHVLTYFLYDLNMSRDDERALFERALQSILRHVFPSAVTAGATATPTVTPSTTKDLNKQAHQIASQWLMRSPQHCFQVALLRVLLILTTKHYLVRTDTNNVLLVGGHIGSSTLQQQHGVESSQSTAHSHASAQYMSHYTCRMLCKHPLLTQVCYEALRQLLTSHYARLSEKQKHAFVKLLPSPLIRKWPTTSPDDIDNNAWLLSPAVANRHFAPDLMPLFQRSFVRQFQHDIFALYPHMLTEMCLKLALHLARHMDLSDRVAHADSAAWAHILCEYLHAAVVERKLLRKLLLLICGTRERYRQTRDLHELGRLVTYVKSATGYRNFGFMPPVVVNMPISNSIIADENSSLVVAGGATTTSSLLVHLNYDELAKVVENVKSCRNIAMARVSSWQAYCQKERTTLTFLIRLANAVDAHVCPILLSLISLALGIKTTSLADLAAAASSSSGGSFVAADSHIRAIVVQTFQSIDQPALSRFIHKFLLESDREELRWHTEYVLLGLYKYASLNDQRLLIGLLWQEWVHLPTFGSHACQFIDLLGHIYLRNNVVVPAAAAAAASTVINAVGSASAGGAAGGGGVITMKDSQCREFIAAAVRLLREQNVVLHTHANAQIYAVLHELTGTESYYLEATPCSSCHARQVPARSQKLSVLKVDARYTSNTLLYKLSDCYEIEAVAVKLMDVKRVKMIKTINVYRNRRLVDSIIDMKNSPATLWHLVKTVQLQKGQTDIAIEFSLPFTATYLIFEIVDFYEDRGVASGSLQCPRCSSLVPRAQRICSNCSENVFQCLKCRSINYDEHEPFLCHSCGFSRYAKFDVNLICKRSVVGVLAAEPIDNDEQRLRVMETLKAALERADQLQQQITLRKQQLQTLLLHLRQTELSSSLAPAQLFPSPTHKNNSTAQQNAGGVSSNAAAAGKPKPAAAAAGRRAQPAQSAASGTARRKQQAVSLTQPPSGQTSSPPSSLTTPSSHVLLSQIARIYFHDCRMALDQLSVQMRRIQACKKQLQTYAARQELYYASTPSIAADEPTSAVPAAGGAVQEVVGSGIVSTGTSRFCCYGCAITLVRSLLRLLYAMAKSRRKHLLHNVPYLIEEIINNTLHFGPSPLRLESRNVLVAMTHDSMRVTMELSSRILAHVATVRQRCGSANEGAKQQQPVEAVQESNVNDAASSSAIVDGDIGNDSVKLSNESSTTAIVLPTTNTTAVSATGGAAEQLTADMSSQLCMLISLLEISCRREDRFWEIKLRCLLSLLAIACRESDALLRETIALPCLTLINKLLRDANEQISSMPSYNNVSFSFGQQPLQQQAVMRTAASSSMALQRALLRQFGLGFIEQTSTLAYDGQVRVNLRRWMGSDPQQHSYAAWLHRMPKKFRISALSSSSSTPTSTAVAVGAAGVLSGRALAVHEARLMEKFGNRWRQRVLMLKKRKSDSRKDLPASSEQMQMSSASAEQQKGAEWFKQLLFHRNSYQLRQQSARMLQQIFSVSSHRRWLMDSVVMPFIPSLALDDESISSFCSFVASVLSLTSWAVYLTSPSDSTSSGVVGLPQLLARIIGERADQFIQSERRLLAPTTHSTMSMTSLTSAEPTLPSASFAAPTTDAGTSAVSSLLAASGFLGYGVELMSELLLVTLVPAKARTTAESPSIAVATTSGSSQSTPSAVVVVAESNAVVKRVREALLPQILHSYLVFKRLLLLRTQKIELAEQRLRQVLSYIGTQSGDEGARLLIVECMNQLERLGATGGLKRNAMTAQFVYEYLCDIIFQDKQEKIACTVLIEKDPLQEDFIQGHMSSRPYPLSDFTPSSNASGTNAAATGAGGREVNAAAGTSAAAAATTGGGKSYEPTMRDVKNKICRDCELIALLDDDTALELLVCGRIISLDLPVSAVYKHIWLAPQPTSGGSTSMNKEGSPMRITYRLRGLLGDATEEFVEKVGEEDASQEDLEAKFRLAGALATTDASGSRLFVVLRHLREATTSFFHGIHGPFFVHVALLEALIKMLSYCVQVRSCRQALLANNAEWNTMSIVLHAAEALLAAGSNANMQQAVVSGIGAVVVPQATVLQMLVIVEILIVEASSSDNADCFNVATADDIQILWRGVRNVVAHNQHHYFNTLASSSSANTTSTSGTAGAGAGSGSAGGGSGASGGANTVAVKLLHSLLRCIALLINGSPERARALAVELEPHADFAAFDATHTFDAEDNVIVEYDEHAVQLDALSTMMAVVPHREPLIVKFKDSLLETGLIDKPLDYMQRITPTLMNKGSSTEEFQECIRQPSLRIILRMLTGFCRNHTAAQSIVGQRSVMLLHRLENVSTPLSLPAENFIEVLKENGDFTTLIENVREQSRTEKKKKAMATRAKQLQSLGMSSVGTQGKIKVASPSTALSAGIGELGEHSLLVCCVCKEGYAFYPHKLLTIYAFTRKQAVNGETPMKAGFGKVTPAQGFSTVSHFNMIHSECHQTSVKGTKDQWEKAKRHNADTKCNCMLPIWAASVSETAYSNALAKYTHQITTATGLKDVDAALHVHDLKLLMLRFAEHKSFSEDSKGGGPDSNLRFLPFLMQTALYKLLSEGGRLETENIKMLTMLERSISNPKEVVEMCKGAESPLYLVCLHLLTSSYAEWKQSRIGVLRSLIIYAHVMQSSSPPSTSEFEKYRTVVRLYCFIELMYKHMIADESLMQCASTDKAGKTTLKSPSSSAKVDFNEPGAHAEALQIYLRQASNAVVTAAEKVLSDFENDVLPAESIGEALDCVGALGNDRFADADTVSRLVEMTVSAINGSV